MSPKKQKHFTPNNIGKTLLEVNKAELPCTNEEMFKMAFSLGASDIKKCLNFPRKSTTIKRHREEFGVAIKPIFLKYLPIVDPSSVQKIFSKAQIEELKKGRSPMNWNVHHQKPLILGGRNFEPYFEDKIRSQKLSEAQQKEVDKAEFPELKTLYFQLDNYLQKSLSQKRLEKDFSYLFRGHLILIPISVHEKFETEFLQPQQTAGFAQAIILKDEEDEVDAAVKQPLFYFVWARFIYGGKEFPFINYSPLQKEEEMGDNPRLKEYQKKKSKSRKFHLSKFSEHVRQ